MKAISTAFLTAASAAHAALSISLPGTSESGQWHELGISYAGNNWSANGYPTAYPGAAAWPAPVGANGAGSTTSAAWMKVSGNGYFSGGSVYDAGLPGMYSLSDDTPPADLATLVLQIDSGAAVGVAPVLNYNGGSQALAANYFASVDGNYIANGFSGPYPTTNYAWQWDLTGIAGPITSYELIWGSVAGNHLSQYEINLSAGDGFVQVVPEPSSFALASLASLVLIRRRR